MAIRDATLSNLNTRPSYLVLLDGERYSSRETAVGLYTWTEAGISVQGPTVDGSGNTRVDISLDDDTSTWPAKIVAGIDQDAVATVWIRYVADDGMEETQEIFDGVISVAAVESDADGQIVKMRCVSDAPDVRWTPRISWRSDFALRRGAQVTINNETFILE